MVAGADYYYVFIVGSAYIFYPVFSRSSVYLYFILKVSLPLGNDHFFRGNLFGKYFRLFYLVFLL